jgi:PBP1b-binding outer membrane lipoprotein LpoB
MSRCVGFGLALIATLLIGGCSDTKPDAPQASPPISADTSAVDSADVETPAAVPAEGSAPGDPAMDPSATETPAKETKPTVLSAIGKAVAGALGASDDGPSEAPAYEPPE